MLLRRNLALLAGCVLPVLLGPIVFRWALTKADPDAGSLILGAVLSLCGFVGLVYVLRANPLQGGKRGELLVDEDGVSFEGSVLATRDQLTAGFVLPAGEGRTRVRLERRWPVAPIELLVDGEKEGRSVLEALELDATQRVASFVCASEASTLPLGPLVMWMSLAVALFGPMLVFPLTGPGPAPLLVAVFGIATFLLWIVLCSIPKRVVVGTDGVVTSWLFRKRFLRYEDVRGVRPLANRLRGVSLIARTGRPMRLAARGFTVELEERRAAIVVQRLQQAMKDHRRRQGAAGALPVRGERPLDQWIRALRAAGSGGDADHRSAPILSDDLWQLVEDPAAEPEARAGAAIALGASLDPSGQRRLRIAAEATAAPEVRTLLQLAADGADEDELEPALRRLRRA